MIETILDTVRVRDKVFRQFITRDEIAAMVRRIASEINADFAGQELVLLVILKGAMVFASDLIRELRIPVSIEFLQAASYHDSLHSKGHVELEDKVPDIEGRHVLIVEDIIDSGLTMKELIKHLSSYRPASVSIASLLSKPDAQQDRVQIDYLGREIPPCFVIGYGLDYGGHGRQYGGIWSVSDDNGT